jgi:hypothetical protein
MRGTSNGKIPYLKSKFYNKKIWVRTEFLLTIALTIVLTSLIVMGANWIKRNKEKHPEIYKHRGISR